MLLLAGLSLASPAAAQGDPPEAFSVVTVPWVGTAPEVPHDAVDGEWHFFQAVARGPCDQTIQFRWDFDGDGAWDTDWANAPNRWNLGAQHTLPAQPETRLFVARVEARCGAEGEPRSAEFFLRVRVDPTRTHRVNRAISNALWHAHANMSRDPATARAWWGVQSDIVTSLATQAMMNRGHRAGVDPAVDPYVEDVQWGLHYIASRLSRVNLSTQSEGVEPDQNGNGYGLRGNGNENYQNGPVLEALASWGDPDYVLPADLGIAEVRGRRLGDVVQDNAEYFWWSQSDIQWDSTIVGGWTYSANGGVDTSQIGWTAVGLFAAEVNGGVQTPSWVKDRLYNAARYTSSTLCNGPAGGYGYNNSCTHGHNIARSGSMLNALGFALSRNPNDQRVTDTVNFLRNNWGGVGNWGNNLGNFYAMFQVSKGMRSYVPAFERIGDDAFDWYAVYADWLIGEQRADGSWTGDNTWIGNDAQLCTALGLLVLIPTVFEAPPVAVAAASPVLAGPGDQVTFSHRQSYSPDPGVALTAYRWNFIDYPEGLDLNGDGDFTDAGEAAPEDVNGNGRVDLDEIVWDFETDDPDLRPTFTYAPTLGFGEEVTYRVTLQVEDQVGRADIDDESVIVRIAVINHPPVALPHPSGDPDRTYDVVPGRTYLLDGSRSFDPDSDDPPFDGFPADSLTLLAWDLDQDDVFEAVGAQVPFAIPAEWAIGTTRVRQFRVCDDGRWIGLTDEQCGGDCSLCAQHSVKFRVVENQPPVARVAPYDLLDEGGSLRLSAAPSRDPEGGDLTYAWDCGDLPTVAEGADLQIDAAALDGPLDGARFDCNLTVTDDLGVSNTAIVPVDLVNRPPIVESVVVMGAPEGEPVTVTVTATDPAADDAGILRYSVDCDGDGILDVLDRPEPVLICEGLDDGTYVIAVLVTDDDGGQTVFRPAPIEITNRPPTLEAPPCPAAVEGAPVALQLLASDPGGEGDPLTCRLAAPAPAGARIDAAGCRVTWTPTYAQARAGATDFRVVVRDDEGAEAEASFTCSAAYLDADEDGLPDTWEGENGLDPTQDDCDADADGDGLSNCEEFDGGTDPNGHDGATPPILIAPVDGARVPTPTPDLVLRNARSPIGRPLAYEYTIFADAELNQQVARSALVDEGDEQTIWATPADAALAENTTYWWTARAHDGLGFGDYAPPEAFVVDAVDEPPTAPRIAAPEDGDQLRTDRPVLAVDEATDPDPDDTLTYECEVARDAGFAMVSATGGATGEGDGQVDVRLSEALEENRAYFARCRAVDGRGVAGPWSETVGFSVNQANEPPTAPTIVFPAHEAVVGDPAVTLEAGPATDPEGDALTYRFWLSRDARFPEADTWVSDEIAPGEDGAITFPAPELLADDADYFWRVRARDPFVAGPAATARFRVDQGNRPPTTPRPLNPAADSISTPSPRFIWGAASDPDGDPLRYTVRLFDAEADEPRWTTDTAGLVAPLGEALPPGAYVWDVRAQDPGGLTSDWSAPTPFEVPAPPPAPDAGPLPDMAVPDAAPAPDAAPEVDMDPTGGSGDGVDQRDGGVDGGDPAGDLTGGGCYCDAGTRGGAPIGAALLLALLAVLRGRLRKARAPRR
ncbi:MAG: hypothetical protein H6704_17755 [Myxococcales bacterium]|nr:hypothetical protein [Myxococcales bacterium]